MPVSKLVEHPLVNVAIQGTDADGRIKPVSPCRRQGGCWGIPVYDDLMLDIGGKGVIAADLQRSALGGLVVVVDLLALIRRVPELVIVAVVVEILPALDFFVDRLAAASQLLGYVAYWPFLVQQGLYRYLR